MLNIRLLGGFDLSLAGKIRSKHLGSKPRALIAFLAMAGGASVSRDKLVGLLWGGSDEAHARHSLRQALTTIRSAFGTEAAERLETSEGGVRLRPDGLELDVEKFERASRSADLAELREACTLYRGEFLDGLHLNEPEFEEWMLSERYRLNALAATACSRLMNMQVADQDNEAVAETARDLTRISPLDETAHARLIEAYGALGQLGLAEAHHKRCQELFRREIDRDAGEEVASAIAMARTGSQHSAGAGASVLKADSAHAASDRIGILLAGLLRNWRSVVAIGTVVLLLAGAGMILAYRIGGTPNTGVAAWNLPDRPSIAILPFDPLEKAQDQVTFARGLTNDIITDLSKFSHLMVISAQSSSRFAGGEDTAEDVARKLGVRYVLNGSLQFVNGNLSVHANLVDAISKRHVWSDSFNRPKKDLFAVQKEVTEAIAAAIGSEFGQLQQAEIERVRRIPTSDLKAYGHFVRGFDHFWKVTRDDNRRARKMFERALDTDPDYALALAFASLTYATEVFQGWTESPAHSLHKADVLARRAVQADPTEPKGYLALGSVHQAKAHNDQAISLFETAYRLNPNDYVINQALAFALTYSGAADRGVELMENAQRLNPYHTLEPLVLAWSYFYARRYDDALKTLHRVKHRSITYWVYKAAIHAQLDQADAAKTAIAEAKKLDPDLSLQRQHAERLASGLVPHYADFMIEALRKAGLQ